MFSSWYLLRSRFPLRRCCRRRAPILTRPRPRGGFIARAPPAGRRCPPPPPPPPPRAEHGAGQHRFRGSARTSRAPGLPPVARRCLQRYTPGGSVCTGSVRNSGEARRKTCEPASRVLAGGATQPGRGSSLTSPSRASFGSTEQLRPAALLPEAVACRGERFSHRLVTATQTVEIHSTSSFSLHAVA
ncbi:protein VASP homolog isoform X2 [Apus apus]|uniref:protein VASP homolog isoform X2 n=1 Tax=Apus apus TaxID=8895 RepID=UPI0021F89BC5|nr:protein VASP homolog isoform X2 [Apus apus]